MSSLLKFFSAALVGMFLHCSAGQAQSAMAEFEGLDDGELDESIDFVIGNAMFVIMHEAGHMLVSEFGLPVLGREEDAVDSLSALIMLEADDEVFDQALIDASDGWFLSGELTEEYSFWGEHSVDDQRAYAIVCMMVGQDAEQFGDLEAAQELPEERRESCAHEYQRVSESWTSVLEPHTRKNGGESNIEIVYDDAASPELEPYAAMFREGDLLSLAKLVADQYRLEDGITFRATSCGVENAFWSPSERTLTYCYELSRFHAKLVGDYFRKVAAE